MTIDYWKLRVTLSETVSFDSILPIVKKYSGDCYIGCVETGSITEKPHTHWYLELRVSHENVRKALRRLGLKGNKDYSLKTLDGDKPLEYCAYCLKQDRYVHNGLTQEFIEECIEYDLKVKDEMKNKKKRGKTQLQQIMEDVDFTKIITGESHSYTVKRNVVQAIVLWYKEKGILIREFALKSNAQTILLKYYPDYVEDLTSKITNQITDL